MFLELITGSLRWIRMGKRGEIKKTGSLDRPFKVSFEFHTFV